MLPRLTEGRVASQAVRLKVSSARSPICAGMTPDSTHTGLAMAAENIASFLKGAPTHVVAPAS